MGDDSVRVLMDATALPEKRGGVARYVDELVARLPQHDVDLRVACQPRDVDRYAGAVGAEHVHVLPSWAESPAPRLGWEQTGLPLLVRRIAPDVVHSPHYTMPLFSETRARNVVTLHDATFFSAASLHLGVKARFFRAWTRISAHRADALVAPSEATRDQVFDHVKVRPEDFAVIPHGVDHERFHPPAPDDVAKVRRWLGIGAGERFITFLGTLEPRKNVPALVRGFVMACRDRPDPPVLVLAGGAGWDQQIDAQLAAVPSGLRVLRPGFVPDGLVPALLGGADIVAYPALGEGFGLPVLEAMACGSAVLTTRRLALPEVGGEAVEYARTPSDVDLATALADLLDDRGRRARLSTAALARAALFTWDAAAERHAAVYRSVAA